MGAFVLVSGPEPYLQRPASAVYGEVILTGWKAAVDRARPDQVAPFRIDDRGIDDDPRPVASALTIQRGHQQRQCLLPDATLDPLV